LQGRTRYGHMFYNPVLIDALGKAGHRSHISDHLSSIFFFALDAKPRLMVELGTGGGESTRVLLAAASIAKSTLLSIDVKDCGQLALPFKEHWHFVQSDDIEFGEARFTEWCLRGSIEPRIDLLLVDTSHRYEHTKKELKVWSPYLSDNAIMLLHDTNMGPGVYGRMDGSVGIGFDNERGVIRALEEFVGRQFDEKSFFCDLAGGYLITHYPHCNGLAVLKKYEAIERAF
jgi:predicted O-methyltransferase YrrM